jgi:hypothetical protein
MAKLLDMTVGVLSGRCNLARPSTLRRPALHHYRQALRGVPLYMSTPHRKNCEHPRRGASQRPCGVRPFLAPLELEIERSFLRDMGPLAWRVQGRFYGDERLAQTQRQKSTHVRLWTTSTKV